MGLSNRLKNAWRAFNGYHLTQWSPDRNSNVRRSQSARLDIPYAVRRKMLDWSREMERKDPIFNSFLDLCERYVTGPTGIRIVSGSSTPAWAESANIEWDGWQPYCDIATRFSFGQRQGLIEREVEVAGEVFIYKCFGSSNRPRIQLIESESVETPPDKQNQADIVDGIQVDSNDRSLSYFVKSRDGKSFTEIPAENMLHIVEPSRVGQLRGLPIIYPVLRDMVDLTESINLETVAQKDAAETSKVIKNANGEMSPEDFRMMRLSKSTQTAAGTDTTQNRAEYFQEKLGGRTVILKTGEDMAQFQNTRPGDAVQKFWDFVSARIGAGLGLPIEIMIMRSLQGTMTRAALDMANGFFRCRAAARAESFGQIWEHVIFNTPSLNRGRPVDWRKIRYTPPRSINVDVGRNSRALIDEWMAGFRTLEDIAGEMGKDWKDILRQRALELSTAKEIETKFGLTDGALLTSSAPPPPAQPDLQHTDPSL